jgi:hypothetical protein
MHPKPYFYKRVSQVFSVVAMQYHHLSVPICPYS